MSQQGLDLQTISDRMEIHDVLVRYCTAIDTKDYELLDTCFTEDAHLDYSAMKGPSDRYPVVRAWLEESLQPMAAMQHCLTNTVYNIDGDRASTRTQFRNPNTLPKPDGGVFQFTVGGYYDDELIRTDKGWKIAKRVEVNGYIEGELPGRG